MAPALRELSRQTGVNILFEPRTTAGRTTQAIADSLTAEDAARRLVASSGLEVVRDATGSLIVRETLQPATQAAERPTLRQSIAASEPPPPAPAFNPPPAEAPTAAAPVRASAQNAVPDATGLEEVVVTATRQADNVNRVPLSIAAVTQQTLDQQGIKQAADLTRLVPGLNIASGSSTPGIGTFSIRGIVGGTGAATTGVYLDDTSLTKRANNGVQQNNGAPLPILFDLERVEVLKGPQGTLYGGSSQGGTIRFITPNPSVTNYSGLLRVEGKSVKSGEEGYEIGAAVGGPIIQDKVGFRASVMKRETPGYLDALSPYTGKLVGKDINGVDERVARISLLWQVTERASVKLTTYSSKTVVESQIQAPTTVYSKSADGKLATPGETFTTPQVCLNTQTRNLTTQPIFKYDPSLPMNTAPQGIAVYPGNCTAATPAAARFVRPSYTYGPFDYVGKDDALLTNQQTFTGNRSGLDVYDLTLSYDFDAMSVRSITSYIHDEAHSFGGGGQDQNQRQTIVGGPSAPSFPLWAPQPDYGGLFHGQSKRHGIQQELRFSSSSSQKPLNWVGGVYFSNQLIHQTYYFEDVPQLDQTEMLFAGVNSQQRYGIENICGCNSRLEANITDTEIAAYGEANYWITDQLKVTGGVRFSRIGFDYYQVHGGVFNGRYPNTIASGTIGNTVDNPITPKIGLTYEFTSNDLVYLNAAKGFRAGGLNSPLGQVSCAQALAQFGITANDVPYAFGPDNVWSYEAGGKFRLLDNRLQLNGAVYRIDWTGIQSTVSLTCGQSFAVNGGKARSQGFDLQAQFRPLQSLILSLNTAYTDAKYIDAVAGPRGIAPNVPPAINAGDPFNIPKWQISASAQYDFTIGGFDMYARGDYQWQGRYQNSGSYGVAVYNPYNLWAEARDTINARVGVRFDRLDLNLFANNLFNGREPIGNAGVGVTGCAANNLACTSFQNFNPFVSQQYERPREIGVQASYRF